MKIALICNTYIRNYGSILQSLASYKVLQVFGNEVKVINYKDYPTSKAKKKIFWYVKLPLILNPITLIAKIKKVFRSKANPDFLKIRRNREMSMDSFVVKHFDFTAACDSIEEAKNEILKMDTVVVGSDQLWGPVDILRDYHTLSFLPESFKKVSYATSFGVAKLPEYVKPQASSFLKRFQYISVREDSGADIVEQAIGKRPSVVADPTLLLNGEQWSNLLGNERKVDEKYIFAFFLGGNKDHREFVKRVKAITGLQIVSMQHVDEYIDADENFADFNINDASPAEFANLIKHAEFIFTDSFHASIFSIQFHKLFFTFDRYKKTSSNSRNGRIVSLFSHLDLNERHLLGNENIDKLLSKKINYNLVDNILDEWRKNSIDYIKKALK